METLYQVLKMMLVLVFSIGQILSPKIAGGDFPLSESVELCDKSKYIQISAVDEGFDTWQPVKDHGGYRYGPSMILNADGSLDVWSAANGPGDITDMVTYKRYSADLKKRTKEVVAVKPTSESYDGKWTCDPGVIKFGGWYYIGYTTTVNPGGVDNAVCVARSKDPQGPFTEKWTGTGWGVLPQPIIEYTGTPNCFGAGTPSFVLMEDTLYIYYAWADDRGTATRVSTADASDENWPATIEYRGECIPPSNSGDSSDVKYVDEFGRFVAVYVEHAFSNEGCVTVWESFDGLTFRHSGFVAANTCKKLHNSGISGRSDGHIGKDDPVYLSYAYGGADDTSGWGNWATRLHKVTLSLADAPTEETTNVTHSDVVVSPRKVSAVPEIITVKAEQQSYTISKSEQVWVMAFDTDGFCFPILTGVKYYGYDTSVVKIVGGRLYPVNPGTTRVSLQWHNFWGDFVVNVIE